MALLFAIYAEVITHVVGSLEAVRIARLSPNAILSNKLDDALTKLKSLFITQTFIYKTQGLKFTKNAYIIRVKRIMSEQVDGWQESPS